MMSKQKQDWRIIPLDVAFPFTSKPRGLAYSAYDEIPFIPMELIPNDRLYIDRYILKKNNEISSGTYVEKGDFLVSKITPCFENGKQGIVKDIPLPFAVATTEVIPMKDVQDLSDRRYLAYYLLRQDVRASLAQKMVGTTGRQRLGKDALSSLQIELPPLQTQQAIINILRAVQQAKEVRQQELALERERKAALMDHLFTHGTRNEPRKHTEIGEIPKSWDLPLLGDLCESSAFGPRFGAEFYALDGNVATLRTTDFDDDGNINYSTMPLANLEIKRFSFHILQEGDLLISRSGTCGIAAVFEDFDLPVLPGAFCIRFRLLDSANSLFLRYYINSRKGRERVLRLAKGAIQKNLTGTDLKKLAIPMPEQAEKEEITNIIKAQFRKLSTLENEFYLLNELFQAVLEELMTGRLSVQPLLVAHREAVAI